MCRLQSVDFSTRSLVLFLRFCPNIYSFIFLFFFRLWIRPPATKCAQLYPWRSGGRRQAIQPIPHSSFFSCIFSSASLLLLLRFPCTFSFIPIYYTFHIIFISSLVFRIVILFFSWVFCFPSSSVFDVLFRFAIRQREKKMPENESTALRMPLCLELITQPGKHCTLSLYSMGRNLLYTHSVSRPRTRTHPPATITCIEYGETESEIGHVEMWMLLD